MNLEEFVEKYSGKKVDFDGVYGAQCVDLARQYFKDVWGFAKQPEPVIGAQDFCNDAEKRPIQRELCDCIPFLNANEKPPVGSVVVFSASTSNKYGHIGICLAADGEGIDLFEQDGFRQDGAKIAKWKYDRLLGWLQKK
jgi:hypothetical protein